MSVLNLHSSLPIGSVEPGELEAIDNMDQVVKINQTQKARGEQEVTITSLDKKIFLCAADRTNQKHR